MPYQVLKSTISEYGIEEAIRAIVELIKEGYLDEYCSLHLSRGTAVDLHHIGRRFDYDLPIPQDEYSPE